MFINFFVILIILSLCSYAIYKTSLKGNFSNFYSDKDWLHSTKLSQMGVSFLWIPMIIVAVIIIVSILHQINLFDVIPSEEFTLLTNSPTYIQALQIALYLYFKILMNGQTAIIGLIGLEVVKLDKEKKKNVKDEKNENYNNKSLPNEFAKYVTFYNKFHEKSLKTKNRLLKYIYEIVAYKIIWNQWWLSCFLYVTMTFAFGTKIFN